MNNEEQVQQPMPAKGGTGLQANIAGALAYFLGPVTGVLFLLIEKDNKFVRFHAMQSTITFGLLTLLAIVPIVGWVFMGIGLIPFVWIILEFFLMYKAFNNEEYELPVVGDIARKQMEKV